MKKSPKEVINLSVFTLSAVIMTVLIVFIVILPAEYHIDPTGIGAKLGLTQLNKQEAETTSNEPKQLTLIDNVGGNQQYLPITMPEKGDPIALPNPDVFQKRQVPPNTIQRVINLKPGEQTETKMLMQAGQSINFSWSVEQASMYVDFHGHEPDEELIFVRYEELDFGKEGHGSLSAPFSGEHGWLWVNLEEVPVQITININGYYEKILEYGVTSIEPF